MIDASQKKIVAQVMGHLGMSYDASADSVAEVLSSARVVGGGHGQPLTPVQAKIVRKGLRGLGIKDEPKTVRPSYRQFIRYIVLNDDRDASLDTTLPSVCVSMVAHMFNKDVADVVRDVAACIEKHDA